MTNTITDTAPTDAYTLLRNEVRETARELHRLPATPSEADIEETTDELMGLCSTVWFLGQSAASGTTNPFVRNAL